MNPLHKIPRAATIFMYTFILINLTRDKQLGTMY